MILLFHYYIANRFCKYSKKKTDVSVKFIMTRSIHSIPALHSNYFFHLCSDMISFGAESCGWLTKRQVEMCFKKTPAPSQAHSCLSSHPAWSSLHKHGLMAGLILAPLALGRSCTSETPKSRLHSRAFPAFPWTTRWQFPISKRGLSVPVGSCPAAA